MAREEKASLEKLLEDPKKVREARYHLSGSSNYELILEIAFLVNFDLVEKGGHEETVMSHNNLWSA